MGQPGFQYVVLIFLLGIIIGASALSWWHQVA
jgi:hypothetical protein